MDDRNSSNERLTLLVSFYVLYLFLGAVFFDIIEKPHETQMIDELNTFIDKFHGKHNSCISDTDLNDFIKTISHSNDRGIPATKNVTHEQNWSFGQSVFYAGTVLTTIGYGSFSPLTTLGKLFLILFSVIGLPVTLLLLYAIIERLMKFTSCMLRWFSKKTLKITSNISALSNVVNRGHMHVIFALFVAFNVFIFLLVIPAGVYAHIEKWTYLNSFYYCLISLSTVGLGDYIPGDSDVQKHRHLYKLCSTIYLLIGVTTMVWLLEIFSETPAFNFYKYFTLTENGILTKHQDKIHDMECLNVFDSIGVSTEQNPQANTNSKSYERQCDQQGFSESFESKIEESDVGL